MCAVGIGCRDVPFAMVLEEGWDITARRPQVPGGLKACVPQAGGLWVLLWPEMAPFWPVSPDPHKGALQGPKQGPGSLWGDSGLLSGV